MRYMWLMHLRCLQLLMLHALRQNCVPVRVEVELDQVGRRTNIRQRSMELRCK